MQDSFSRNNNGWWKRAAQRMASGTASDQDWEEANRRLWCLSRTFREGENLGSHDRQDLVQTVFLRLQVQEVVTRLTEVDTPAHYLRRLMQNHLRNEGTRAVTAREVVRAPRRNGSGPSRPAAGRGGSLE